MPQNLLRIVYSYYQIYPILQKISKRKVLEEIKSVIQPVLDELSWFSWLLRFRRLTWRIFLDKAVCVCVNTSSITDWVISAQDSHSMIFEQIWLKIQTTNFNAANYWFFCQSGSSNFANWNGGFIYIHQHFQKKCAIGKYCFSAFCLIWVLRLSFIELYTAVQMLFTIFHILLC